MKSKFKKMDKTLLFLMIAFTIFGLVMIFSASSITAVLYYNLEEYHYFKKHLVIIALSWTFGLVVLNQPLSRYKVLGPLGIIVVTILLIGLYPYGIVINNARSWYDLGFFLLQPSEFAKSITIVYLAVTLDQIYLKKNYDISKIMIPFCFIIVITGLTLFQQDLGTATIIGGIAFFIFLAIPFNNQKLKKLKLFSVVALIIAIAFVLVSGKFLTEEQAGRLNYRKPCTRATEKSGYQVCNAFIAISNGGLLGTGLGDSIQKYMYLPEAYTDFVFPVIIEEIGAIGGIVVVILFMVMLFRILRIARSSNTLTGSIIAYGTFIFLLLHLLINFLGVLALMPLTGIPVPFLSYGGSFYINIIFMLFLTQRVQIETVASKQAKILRS